MAINAYVGLMGSGKSYEVVSSIILPAVQSGRRVVSNIDGLNPDAIYSYLEEKTSLDRSNFGQIICVTNEDVCSSHFFPTDEESHDGKIVQGGDLICIDEVWRFWGSDCKISPSVMNFFRMHRHFTHSDTSLSCDLALMTQDISSLHRNLRSVVEMTSKTVKLKALGLHSRYRIEIYEGWKISSKSHIDTYNKKYRPEIFPLYKSYASGDGKEAVIDFRQNILNNKKLWFLAAGFLIFGSVGLYGAFSFFHVPDTNKLPVNPAITFPMQNNFSSKWRIVGEINSGINNYVVIANESGRLRYESRSQFHNFGRSLIGDIDGQKVTYWTGSVPSARGSSLFPPPETGQPSK